MSRLAQSVTAIACIAVGYCLSALAGSGAEGFVHDLVYSVLSIIIGLLIGAVGVYLSTVTALEERLGRLPQAGGDRISRVIGAIEGSLNQVRQNVLMTILLLAAAILLQLAKEIDWPGLVWPFTSGYLTKAIIANGLTLGAGILSFVAVYDCVSAMFTLHRLSGTLAENAQSTLKPRE